jgi:acetyltransferase-like isoleucine patch superfamily enzyme
MLGHKVGRNVHISILTVLHAPKIEMADDVRIGPLNIIKCGGEVKIGFSSEISFLVIIYGRGSFHLGERSYVSVKTFIDTTGGVEIGDYSGTGPGTMIFSHAIFLPPTKGFPRVIKKTTIGNYVWLGGMNFVTAGSVIGDRVMSLPGSVISKQVDSEIFFAGKDHQLTLSKVCKKMSEIETRLLVKEILQDFAHLEKMTFGEDGELLYIGNHRFQIISGLLDPLDPATIYFLISDGIRFPGEVRWYNVLSLECSRLCNNRFGKKLQIHMRRYFGLHFVYSEYKTFDEASKIIIEKLQGSLTINEIKYTLEPCYIADCPSTSLKAKRKCRYLIRKVVSVIVVFYRDGRYKKKIFEDRSK